MVKHCRREKLHGNHSHQLLSNISVFILRSMHMIIVLLCKDNCTLFVCLFVFCSSAYLFTGFHSQNSVLSIIWACVGVKMQPL